MTRLVITTMLKRKLNDQEESESQWMDYKRLKKQYFQVTGNFNLEVSDFDNLLHTLHAKLLLVFENEEEIKSFRYCEIAFDHMKARIKQCQKRAIDYVALWDAKTPETALNWLISHPDRDCRYNFVKLLLKEQPDKNFWEALQRVCKAWKDMRSQYSYQELFYDEDAKSDEIKLKYCNWLKTDKLEKKPSIKLYRYKELVKRLYQRLSHKKMYSDDDVKSFYLKFKKQFDQKCETYAINYMYLCNARTPEKALNWIISHHSETFRRDFVYKVQLEQPKKNFWEALIRVYEATKNLNLYSQYSYEELFNLDKNDKDSIMLEYCDWLRKGTV